jgi:UDP-N-acetylmuramate dehydrogenase
MQTSYDTELTNYNTLGIRARAKKLVVLESLEDVRQLAISDEPVTVLGGGSNVVLAGDQAHTIALMRLRGRSLVREAPDAWHVRAMAGESWHALVCWTLEQGWAGLENLSLIPGTVGAAPIQNIGAYGVELCERFESLEATAVGSGEQRVFTLPECCFGYRESLFKRSPGEWIITAVTLRLPRPWCCRATYRDLADELALAGHASPSAAQLSEAVIKVRRRKLPDPQVLGNVGSFFKNPVVAASTFDRLQARFPDIAHHVQRDGAVKLAAAWLIEACGAKQLAVGAAAVHQQQALVLVNRGGATGAQILALAEQIAREVMAKFGVTLVQEPVIL